MYSKVYNTPDLKQLRKVQPLVTHNEEFQLSYSILKLHDLIIGDTPLTLAQSVCSLCIHNTTKTLKHKALLFKIWQSPFL